MARCKEERDRSRCITIVRAGVYCTSWCITVFVFFLAFGCVMFLCVWFVLCFYVPSFAVVLLDVSARVQQNRRIPIHKGFHPPVFSP